MKFDFKTYMEKYLNKEIDYKLTDIKNTFTKGNLNYWLNIDTYVKQEELADIIQTANYIKNNCDVFIVIGIGGSYMGALAVIEAFKSRYKSLMPEIIFLGTDLCASTYSETLEYLQDKNVIVNVISKSGETLEPSIAFQLVLKLLEKKYKKEELIKRVIISTDKKNGSLRKLVNDVGYKSFAIPSEIGGRFSVFTSVGLLPIAVAGIDIIKLLDGVLEANTDLTTALDYSVIRDTMYKQGKFIESYTIYNPKLVYLIEWLKQLFGETQGKDNKGILPIGCINTRDLHSLGQFLQEGKNIMFETVIGVEKDVHVEIADYKIELNTLNNIALDRVAKAHYNGNTPSNIIMISEINEFNLGKMMQIFILSSIMGSLLLEVNPFGQPGVEGYKELLHQAIE